MRASSRRTAIAIAAALVVAGAAAAQPRYRILDLTEIARPVGVAQSEARSVNERGQIVGFELVGDFIEQAILWSPDGTVELLDTLAGDNSNIAVHVTDNGIVLGVSEDVEIVPCGDITKIFEEQKATAWRDGMPLNLNDFVADPGALDFDLRFAWDANRSGQVVGEGRSLVGPPYTLHGFLFERGEVTDLAELDHPTAINAAGQVVGYDTDGQDNAYLWEAGVTTNLHDDPAIGGVTSRAWAIGASGLVAGEAQFDIAKPEEPALWRDGVPERLVPEVDRPQGAALAVAAGDVVVGWYNDLDDLTTGFIGFRWEDGVRSDLLDLLVVNDGWEELFPFDANDRGWIVGGGIRNGELGHGFVMIPVAD